MKQIIYILLTTTMLGLMSCSDWLDVSPKTCKHSLYGSCLSYQSALPLHRT